MSVKKFFQTVELDVEKLFEGAEAEIKKDILPAAIAVTNVLKTVTDFDKPDLIGSIAGQAGTNIEEKVKAVLPTVINDLQLAQQFVNLQDPNAILAATLQFAQGLPVDTKTAFWIEFSGKITQALIDGKGSLSVADAIGLAQYYYHNQPGTAKP